MALLVNLAAMIAPDVFQQGFTAKHVTSHAQEVGTLHATARVCAMVARLAVELAPALPVSLVPPARTRALARRSPLPAQGMASATS